MCYKIEDLNSSEWATLCWLDARGYSANIAQFFTENEDGTATCRNIAEGDAWQVKEDVEADDDAFLACNGSEGLSQKLWAFISSIV